MTSTEISAHDLVAIGASWGGLDAIRAVVRVLPRDLAATVVVAQHRAPESHPTALGELLSAVTELEVLEANDKAPLRLGTVYFAPPDYHLLVDQEALALSTDEPVSYARPSIDVLLESAAESHRERTVGVVLTGANADGAEGLARVAALGGAVIVQRPEDAERDEMPRAALGAVPDALVLDIDEIGSALVGLCGTVGA